MEPGFKKCSKCGEVKGVDEFCKNKSKKNKYITECKKCSKEYQKEYRKTDKWKEYKQSNKCKDDITKYCNSDAFFKQQIRIQNNIDKDLITPEMINLKREQILLYRELQKLKKEIKNGTN